MYVIDLGISIRPIFLQLVKLFAVGSSVIPQDWDRQDLGQTSKPSTLEYNLSYRRSRT